MDTQSLEYLLTAPNEIPSSLATFRCVIPCSVSSFTFLMVLSPAPWEYPFKCFASFPRPAEYVTKTTVVEGFVRDWKFKTKVMDFYDYTCCVSRLKVEPTFALIEAAHINPHAKFGINTITIGIPLCVYLHRAFDHGLISLSDNYTILVKGKKTFKETDSPLNLRQFVGQEILLPEADRYYPSLENLRWHQNRFGFWDVG